MTIEPWNHNALLIDASRINETIQTWRDNGRIFTEEIYNVFREAISLYGVFNVTLVMPNEMRHQMVEYMRNKRNDKIKI